MVVKRLTHELQDETKENSMLRHSNVLLAADNKALKLKFLKEG